jgi:hypothetical protein
VSRGCEPVLWSSDNEVSACREDNSVKKYIPPIIITIEILMFDQHIPYSILMFRIFFIREINKNNAVPNY